MTNVQKKIFEMKQAISNIKSDMQSMRNSNPNIVKTQSNQYTSHTLRKEDIDIWSPKANFTHFKEHCLPKKELSSRLNNYSSACIQQNLTHNNGDKHYHYNYPLKSTNKKSIEIKQYAKLSDFMNTKANQQEALKPKPLFKPKAKNTTRNDYTEGKKINTDYGVSAHQRNIQTNHNAIESYEYPNRTVSLNDKRRAKSAFCSQENSFHQSAPSDYEAIIKEIIDITTRYNNSLFTAITEDNIVSHYRKTIRLMKRKDELVNKMLQVYSSKTGNEAVKEEDNIVKLWRWFKETVNSKQFESKDKQAFNHNTNEYQLLCERIMKDYQIKSIEHLTLVLEGALKKDNKNNSFFEGIKRILLPENNGS